MNKIFSIAFFFLVSSNALAESCIAPTLRCEIKGAKATPRFTRDEGSSVCARTYDVEPRVLIQAVKRNIEIMRTFVGLRSFLSSHKGLSDKITQLEKNTTINLK